ncbi:hypothetical protein EDB83DRAFT_2461360 [Lactarius deliciosus]|nr:hypothetical protein EDB83DRAFT_2461360 [Lactarius deliciosus]
MMTTTVVRSMVCARYGSRWSALRVHLSRPARAQRERGHEGVYLVFGIGRGRERKTAQLCYSYRAERGGPATRRRPLELEYIVFGLVYTVFRIKANFMGYSYEMCVKYRVETEFGVKHEPGFLSGQYCTSLEHPPQNSRVSHAPRGTVGAGHPSPCGHGRVVAGSKPGFAAYGRPLHQMTLPPKAAVAALVAAVEPWCRARYLGCTPE